MFNFNNGFQTPPKCTYVLRTPLLSFKLFASMLTTGNIYRFLASNRVAGHRGDLVLASRRDLLGSSYRCWDLIIGSVLELALKSWCRDTITQGFESRTSVHV